MNIQMQFERKSSSEKVEKEKERHAEEVRRME